jgi:hypothetical protein
MNVISNAFSKLNDSFTAGIGISPLDFLHLDLAGSYGEDNQIGATLRLAMIF